MTITSGRWQAGHSNGINPPGAGNGYQIIGAAAFDRIVKLVTRFKAELRWVMAMPLARPQPPLLGNDYRNGLVYHTGFQHRALGSFDLPLACPDGVVANLGYLGGDFRGLLDQADYIREMGFSAVWITPIAENPDQRFTGGSEITCSSSLSDRGKAAYHGYWAINFHRTDEHLPSADLDFAGLTHGLKAKGLKTVLDIVGNHGSPSWSVPRAAMR